MQETSPTPFYGLSTFLICSLRGDFRFRLIYWQFASLTFCYCNSTQHCTNSLVSPALCRFSSSSLPYNSPGDSSNRTAQQHTGRFNPNRVYERIAKFPEIVLSVAEIHCKLKEIAAKSKY